MSQFPIHPPTSPMGPGGALRPHRPHRGTAILVLGILGLVCMICGIIAWVMGNTDLREMQAGRMDPNGLGLTKAGRICGIIGTLIGIVVLIPWLLLMALRRLADGITFGL